MMIIEHQGKTPEINQSTFIAPSATICGDVKIGPNCRIMHGVSIIAEGGTISLDEHCIVFENAVIRSNTEHSTSIGRFCLIGPNAHLVGCVVEDEVFIATGASIFHGSNLGKGSTVRINGVVHLKTHLKPKQTVPIGWIAVGNPAELFSPDQHESIWKIQKELNFPLTVYGIDQNNVTMEQVTRRCAERLSTHLSDRIVVT